MVYNETTYSVTLPSSSSLEHGYIEAAASVTQYNGGESPVFYVGADEGYYIRALRANGSIVDPYFTSEDYMIDDVLVNGEAAIDGEYDSRVTSFTLTVDGIYRDIVFEIAPEHEVVAHYSQDVILPNIVDHCIQFLGAVLVPDSGNR